MKTLKNKNKGITLIALVITIIVLLILAGISISMLSGDNGILQRATDAKKNTETASAKEQIQIEVLGSYGTDGKLNMNTLKTNLEKIGVTVTDTDAPWLRHHRADTRPPSPEWVSADRCCHSGAASGH